MLVQSTESNQGDQEEINGPFATKSGMIEYEDRKLDGEVTAKFVLYFDNYGTLNKLEETTSDRTSTYIYNDATGKGVTQFPGRSPSQMFMRQGELNRFIALRSTSGFTKQDDEAIFGKNCEVR